MPSIVAYMPTYSPNTEAKETRNTARLTQKEIVDRLNGDDARIKPGMYFDAIDSILNIRPDIKLVVADGKSTDSIRNSLIERQDSQYTLKLYPEKMSQWAIFNDIYNDNKEADYFVYTSSDVIWTMDWVSEAIKEFEKNPKLQILFPMVSSGDGNIPCQVAKAPRDQAPILPPYDQHGRAIVLNMYVAIFRMDFLRTYGGYPDTFRNCYTESFLHYLCRAVDGEMRLFPRGWCFHWGTGDLWQENGSHYYYDEEKSKFEAIMNQVQMMDGAGMLSSAYLKKILWRKK